MRSGIIGDALLLEDGVMMDRGGSTDEGGVMMTGGATVIDANLIGPRWFFCEASFE